MMFRTALLGTHRLEYQVAVFYVKKSPLIMVMDWHVPCWDTASHQKRHLTSWFGTGGCHANVWMCRYSLL